MTLFSAPQIILFTHNIQRAVAFYTALGFSEAFRVPDAPDQTPVHVDLELDGYRIGLATDQTARADHTLNPAVTGHRAVVVLWTPDAAAAHARLLELGARPLHAPHPFLGRLIIAWAEDPDGHPIQVVQNAHGLLP